MLSSEQFLLNLVLVLWEERSPEQELLEQAQEQGDSREEAHVAQSEEDEPALFMVTASVLPDVSNSDSKSTEVIDDDITAPVSVEPKEELPKSMEVIDNGITAPVSIGPEEELQLCITKGHRLGTQFN